MRRKKRLLQMIDMAQVYLGCSKAQVALSLNRDPAKVAPDSGNPKLDLVVGMSQLLDWSVGDVAEALWIDPVEEEVAEEDLSHRSFDDLNREAIEAHREGNHRLMRRIGECMWRLARTPVERGKAANRIMGSYEQAGRYQKALEWARVAASESGVSRAAHLNYLANLSSVNYSNWNLHEAAGIASEVLQATAESTWDDPLVMTARCMAGYVSGNAHRRLMVTFPELAAQHGARAIKDLTFAEAGYRKLAVVRNSDHHNAIANTCSGALLEVQVLLGSQPAVEAATHLLAGLDAVVDPSTMPRGDWLESWGWWAVFGFNIAVQRMDGDAKHHYAAIFSTKALEIADRLENWAIRERVFSLEHDLRSGLGATVDMSKKKWILDRDELRSLLGSMGRFPWFRRTGWKILSSADIV
ncbi:MAG: hypothetical protein KF724_13715 [Phycisphaeraceae bacterium]|nr:hypothetical protein [Phycisphaeraceae bacterium]